MRPRGAGGLCRVGVLSSVARAVTSNVAGALTSRAAGQIAMVGLFVDADDAVIADALVAAKPNAAAARFESPERVAQLRAVWQAGVEGAARRQRQRCRTRRSLCRGYGLDLVRRQDPSAARRHGLAFDWSLLAGYRGALPGLAGGLIRRMLPRRLRTGAPLVDTSSGVESAPGVKDTDKITNSTKPSNT